MNIFNVILTIFSIGVVSGKEYTPVLLWSSESTSSYFPPVSALNRLNTNEFSEYLSTRIKNDKPTVLVFVEENLSVEDFSWKDVDANGAFPLVSNLTKSAKDVAFFPLVHEPFRAFTKLYNLGYQWEYYDETSFKSGKSQTPSIFEVKLSEPDYLEDRPDMLKRHDEEISKIYDEALEHNKNVLAIYTGNHSSWIDAELGRFKREEKDDSNSSSSTLVIKDKNNVVMIATTRPITYIENNAKMFINNIIGEPTIDTPKNGKKVLHVKFQLNNGQNFLEVNIEFTSDGTEWWTLNSITQTTGNKHVLKPTSPIGAPAKYSYFCNPTVKFSYSNISLVFENFQAQPIVGEGNSFGPVLHCIPFFSVAIWSGIMIVFILSIVLAWGIIMIMDINTNDRFDDPKGKTITITATD